MKRFAILFCALCLLLSGCGWFSGSYVSVTPHQQDSPDRDNEVVSANNYQQLSKALEDMIHSGTESRVIHVNDYTGGVVEKDTERAVNAVHTQDPIAAYAVEDISFEFGTNSGLPAIAVNVLYRHDRTELQKIKTVRGMDAVQDKLGSALENCDSSLVLLVNDYRTLDLSQLTEDYAAAHPDTIMEVPAVSQETYPANGKVRVLELRFSYQNSRDDLRQMKQQVSPVFASAALYVSGNDSDARKFSQLHAFLMERFGEYQLKTSITPAYSLLRHGVGDSRAFSIVYAQMCRRAGLECQTVTGTRNGEPWSWNMVCSNEYYYHVDLLGGEFAMYTDLQMENYVWDYSGYPPCTGEPPVEESVPPTE